MEKRDMGKDIRESQQKINIKQNFQLLISMDTVFEFLITN